MRDRILSGRAKTLASTCDPLLSEWASLTWDKHHQDVADGQEDHAAHAALYGHRLLRKYLYTPEHKPPAPGTREWAEAEAERMKQETIRRAKQSRKSLRMES